MSLWDDVVRAGAAVATGGLSEAVLDAAAGTHETAPPPAPSADPPVRGGGGFGGVPSSFAEYAEKLKNQKKGVSGTACGCSRYELKPPFLLDNTTGDVWMFDEHTKRFGKVEVDRHPVAKAVEHLVAAKVALDLRATLETDGLMVNRAQYAELAPFVDQTLKALDTRLEEMRRT